MIDNDTLALHAATRLALDLPAGVAGGAGRTYAPAHPASVAEAFWRLAYAEEGAPVAALSDAGREDAVAFLVDLVRHVERRLLDGSAESPAVLARGVVERAVPTDADEQESLCAQLGIPTVELAPERLSFLAWDLCVSLTENLRPIVAACHPRVAASASETAIEEPAPQPAAAPSPPRAADDVVVEPRAPFLPAAEDEPTDTREHRWLFVVVAAITVAVVASRRRVDLRTR